MNYLEMLVCDFHSTTVATIGDDGHPQTRVIDMMMYDEFGLYFLTAKGKEFYKQLMEQEYVAISSTKDKKAISVRGKVKNIGYEKLDDIFIKNKYMQKIYPEDTRDVLQVFCLYEAKGEYFDISNPSNIFRETFFIGKNDNCKIGYFIGENCIGCNKCYYVCPQKCIDINSIPLIINQN